MIICNGIYLATPARCNKQPRNRFVNIGSVLGRRLAGDTAAADHLLNLQRGDQAPDEGREAFHSFWVAFPVLVPGVQFFDCVDVSFKMVTMAQLEVDPSVWIEDGWENVGAVQHPTCVVGGQAGHLCQSVSFFIGYAEVGNLKQKKS